MSDFGDDFEAAAAPSIMAVHGESITYKPADADSTTVVAAVGPASVKDSSLDNEEVDTGDGTIVYREVKVLTVLTDPTNDPYGGIADPKIGDAINLNSIDWRVIDVGDKLGGLVMLAIEKRPAHRVGRPGFRQ